MRKILVIDDSKTIRKMCEMIHKGLEDTVLTAGSIAEAEALIQKEAPEVIFVDYTLPDGNTIDFIRSHAGTGCGIVMMGGTFAECDPDAALAAGAVSVIIKPFKTDEYFASLDSAYAVAQGAPAATASATPATVAPAVAPKATAAVPPVAGAPKRFNFPGTSQTTTSGLISSPSQPSIGRATFASGVRKAPDQATPKTPVPSISPEITAARVEAAAADTEFIKAEVLAAVKSLLPRLVSNYLKKLIQQEVKPQLQTWVDARVEAVVRKLMQQ